MEIFCDIVIQLYTTCQQEGIHYYCQKQTCRKVHRLLEYSLLKFCHVNTPGKQTLDQTLVYNGIKGIFPLYPIPVTIPPKDTIIFISNTEQCTLSLNFMYAESIRTCCFVFCFVDKHYICEILSQRLYFDLVVS